MTFIKPQIQSDWNQTDASKADYIKNKQDFSLKPIQVTSLTLLSTGWTLVSGLYEYDLSNANITANSIVEVIPSNADIAVVIAAQILPETDSASGVVTIYSVNEPTADISVTINITEKAS